MSGSVGGGTRTLAQPQKLEALGRAFMVRGWRAGVRFVVSSLPEPEGRMVVATVIRERPESAATLSLEVLVGWVHGFGRRRTLRLLADAGLRTNKPVGELTDRQALVLANLLVASADCDRGAEAA